MKPGKPVHPSNGTGAAPDAASSPQGVEVSFDRGSNRARGAVGQVVVSNIESAGGNNLEVSFASGRATTWFSIPPAQSIVLDVLVFRCYLRGASGATAAYSIMGVLI